MIARYGLADRDRFRDAVRSSPVDEQLAADEAERLSRAWIGPLALPDGEFLADVLRYKAAGYNADLHAHVRRAMRAVHAADAWLADADALEVDVPALTLGEYTLLQRAKARGLRVRTIVPLEVLEREFADTVTPVSEKPGYEPVEFDLSLPGTGMAEAPRCDVLFVATMANYLNPIIPVANALARSGRAVGVLLPRAGMAWGGAQRLSPVVMRLVLEDFVDEGMAAAQARWRSEISARWEHCEEAVAAACRMADHIGGISLWPLVQKDLSRLAARYIPLARACRAIGCRLADRVGTAVGARLRRATDLALVRGLTDAGVPHALVIHGHVSRAADRRFVDGDFGRSRILAWNQDQAGAIAAKGVRPDRVVITGNPDWDGLVERGSRAGERVEASMRIAHALGLDETRPVIVLTSQEQVAPLAKELAAAVLRSPAAQLVMKVHPAEDAGPYHAAAVGEGRVRVVTTGGPALHDLLHAADAVLTFHSTTNLEAVCLGTPVISLAMGPLAGVDRLVPLEQSGLPVAESLDSLAEWVNKICQGEQRVMRLLHEATSRAREMFAAPLGGGATQRVIEELSGAGSPAASGCACCARGATGNSSTAPALLIALPSGLIVSGVAAWAVRLVNALAARGNEAGLILHASPAGYARLEAAIDDRVRVWDLSDLPALEAAGEDIGPYVERYVSAAEAMSRGGSRPVVLSPNLLEACYALAARAAERLACVRVVGWLHNDLPYEYHVQARFESLVSRFVPVSTALERGVAGALPHRRGDVSRIAYGVPVAGTCPTRTPRSGRTLRVVYTGRFDDLQKRVSALPFLSDELAARGVEHELALIGDGPLRGAMLEAARSRPALRVCEPARGEAISRVLASADIAVLPSRHEGLSIAVMEAMAAGCVPVIARTASGAAELVEPGVSGVLVSVPTGATPEVVGRAMAQGVIAALPTLETMRVAAHARAAERFSIQTHAAQVEAMLREVAASPRRTWMPPRETGVVSPEARERLEDLLRERAGAKVLIHGSGRHTRELVETLRASGSVVGVADDDPAAWGSEVGPWRVLDPRRAGELGVTDVVLSSRLNEEAMWERRGVYERQGLRVHRLYGGAGSRAVGV